MKTSLSNPNLDDRDPLCHHTAQLFKVESGERRAKQLWLWTQKRLLSQGLRPGKAEDGVPLEEYLRPLLHLDNGSTVGQVKGQVISLGSQDKMLLHHETLVRLLQEPEFYPFLVNGHSGQDSSFTFPGLALKTSEGLFYWYHLNPAHNRLPKKSQRAPSLILTWEEMDTLFWNLPFLLLNLGKADYGALRWVEQRWSVARKIRLDIQHYRDEGNFERIRNEAQRLAYALNALDVQEAAFAILEERSAQIQPPYWFPSLKVDTLTKRDVLLWCCFDTLAHLIYLWPQSQRVPQADKIGNVFQHIRCSSFLPNVMIGKQAESLKGTETLCFNWVQRRVMLRILESDHGRDKSPEARIEFDKYEDHLGQLDRQAEHFFLDPSGRKQKTQQQSGPPPFQFVEEDLSTKIPSGVIMEGVCLTPVDQEPDQSPSKEPQVREEEGAEEEQEQETVGNVGNGDQEADASLLLSASVVSSLVQRLEESLMLLSQAASPRSPLKRGPVGSGAEKAVAAEKRQDSKRPRLQ